MHAFVFSLQVTFCNRFDKKLARLLLSLFLFACVNKLEKRSICRKRAFSQNCYDDSTERKKTGLVLTFVMLLKGAIFLLLGNDQQSSPKLQFASTWF